MKAYTERFNAEQRGANAAQLARFISDAAIKTGFTPADSEEIFAKMFEKTASERMIWTALFWAKGTQVNIRISCDELALYGVAIEASVNWVPQKGSVQDAIKAIKQHQLAVEFAVLLSSASVK